MFYKDLISQREASRIASEMTFAALKLSPPDLLSLDLTLPDFFFSDMARSEATRAPSSLLIFVNAAPFATQENLSTRIRRRLCRPAANSRLNPLKQQSMATIPQKLTIVRTIKPVMTDPLLPNVASNALR